MATPTTKLTFTFRRGLGLRRFIKNWKIKAIEKCKKFWVVLTSKTC